MVDEEFSTASTLNRGKIIEFYVENDGNLVIMSDMINANSPAHSFCRIDDQGNLVDNLADGWNPGLKPYMDGMLFYGFSVITHVDAQNNIRDYYEYAFHSGPPYGHPFNQVSAAQVLPDKTFLAGGWINVDSISPGALGNFRCLLKLDSTGTRVPDFPEFTCEAYSEFSFQSTYVLSLDTNSVGDIIASGSFVSINGVETNHIAKISQDGIVDPSFSTPISGQGEAILQLVDSQDRIWFAPLSVASIEGLESVPKLVRLLPNGQLDETYVHPYLVEDLLMYPEMESYPAGVTELPDGTFIITGFMHEADGYGCKRITHIDDFGTIIDDHWMDSGPSEAMWGEMEKDHFTADVQITDDGKIYIAGQFSEFNGFETSSIVRLKPSPVSVQSISDFPVFEIYPNPGADRINISCPEFYNVQLRIFDTQGKEVYASRLEQSESKLSVAFLERGIYFVLLESPKNGVAVQKFVKQ